MKCSVCRKKDAAPGKETCAGCGEAYERIYGSGKQGETNMAAKKTTGAAKKTATPKAPKAGKGAAAAPPPAAPEEQTPASTPAPETHVELDEGAPASTPAPKAPDAPEGTPSSVPPPPASEPGAAGEGSDEEEEEDDEEEEGGTPAGGAATGKKQHGRSRKTAEKRLENAIARVEQFPWELWGIPGIVAAVALMKTGLGVLKAIPKGSRIGSAGAEKVAEGAIVRVKAKVVDKYRELVGDDAVKGLKVDGIRKSSAVCISAANEKLFFPVRDLEIDPDAKPADEAVGTAVAE